MAKLLSRVQKMEEDHPEDGIGLVIHAMNGILEKGSYENERVNSRAIQLLVKRFQAHDNNPASQEVSTDDLEDALEKTENSINRFLARYHAQPEVRWARRSQTGKWGWDLKWLPDTRGARFLELFAVLEVIKIAQAGHISSLKQCEQCHRWLLARFLHQRFCSAECKERFHATNEADKKRRRDWARANYQSRKELELGSRKAAQHKGGKR